MSILSLLRRLGPFAIAAVTLHAEVHLASPFTSHMVLQREMSVPIWGTAAAGENVTVRFAGQTRNATADADGHWRVNLPALTASEESRALVVTGTKSAQPLKLDDVLVGEVWLASGQSNMAFPVSVKVASYAGLAHEEQEIAAANYPTLRMFTAANAKAYAPQATVGGEWLVCSPATVPAFSAVGYLFARDLQRELKVPVGIITVAFGASTAEAWIRREAMAGDPQLKPMLDRFDETYTKYQAAKPDAAQLAEQKQAYQTEVAAAKAAGKNAPRRARNPDPVQDQHNATVLFNGMLQPVIPYAIRGAIWYQGESIVGGAAGRALYPHVQATLVRDWRKLWAEGDFPFYIVQLAGQEAESNSPVVREAQASILALPNTGMAVTTDIGEAKNVHPHDKQDVGDRLTRIALANTYGRKIECAGPTYETMRVEGNAIRVKFSHLGGGLVARGGPLKRFEIAGTDGQYVSAEATIEGDSVVIRSANVPAPTMARYAWSNFPDGCNLYNAAGLPAPQFRTDAAAATID